MYLFLIISFSIVNYVLILFRIYIFFATVILDINAHIDFSVEATKTQSELSIKLKLLTNKKPMPKHRF